MRTKFTFYFLALASAQALLSQSVAAPPSQSPSPGRYESFLRNPAVVSAKSDDLDAAGVKNQKMKQSVCDSLAVGAADCNLLFQIAVSTNAQLQALDRQAGAIINGVRAKYPHGAIPAGKAVPPPPPQLTQLQAQREALVNSAAAELQQQLSGAGAAALTNRLTKGQNGQ